MARSRWLLVAVLAVVVLAVWATALAALGRIQGGPDLTAVAGVPTFALTVPSGAATPDLTADPSAAPLASDPPPPASPTPTPPASPTPTPIGTAEGDPRLRFIEFQLRLADAAADVQALNEALTDAARAEDDAATVAAAVDMLDFVDRERDWLGQHPPTDCYAEAHRAARAMLADYGAVADGAIDYANATGLDRLAAFGEVLERADVAGDALRVLGDALEAATCLA